MQKSPSNEMIPLWGIMVSLVFLNFAIILHDFYFSFCFIICIFKSFPGIISCIRVSSSATTKRICRNGDRTCNAPAEDQTATDEHHRNLSFSELKTVIENEGMGKIDWLFEEEEPSLMEVKEAFDVFDENKDGFIDAKELRNALYSLGFIKEASEDDCERMIKGFDDNFDGQIDFNEFVKVLERSFCSSN
ncbi:putative calcium-binding protein CML45 [Hibiscus syriacus]|uniref:Calcium-binding protein CML45 n=1 Tax=Hibiscus syriacus TaxID=106335 RepID=A0A6A2X743_HIBSY|nr:probable calcium-binding protein CML47 [Hibiscus syriacus]KAE8670758.1 putative calcium-binding protein CML45 [Hibiscus syriacus]